MASTSPFGSTNSGLQTGINNGSISARFDPVTFPPESFEESINRACLRDLCTTNPRYDKERIETVKGGLLKDAYIWVLDHADFQRWRYEKQSRLLWIKGDPGKGKTMLLCGIIDELVKSASETSIVSFFFCQETDLRVNTATAVLRGLIFMLVDQQPSLISHIREQYDKRGKQVFEDVNAWEVLSEIFDHILQDPLLQTTYLIIDALDECTTGLDRLLELIAQKSSAHTHLKWIVSSRNWAAIGEALDSTSQETKLWLEVNETSVDRAVAAFIHHKVRELAERKKYTDEIRDAVSQHLLSNARGTFLWVAFVCERLSCVSKRHVRKTLQEFPTGLDELYARMLHRINDLDDAELCKSLLSVIATVYRPITLDDLASCIDIPENVADDHEYLEEIIGLCGTFLTLRGHTVSLIHQSAKDFLYHKQKLGPEHPGTLTSLKTLANAYMNQGRWKEAEELLVQVTEACKQVPVPEHADILKLLARAVAHNTQFPPDLEDYDNFEDSDPSIDLSTENESIFSLASIPSTISLESGYGKKNSFLIQEFATLLHENDVLLSLILVGVSKRRIGIERMRNHFRKLLQHFANDLKTEILGKVHRDVRSFVSSYSAMITRELFAMAYIDDKQNIKPPVSETEHRIASVEKRSAQERKVEDYLESLHTGRAPPKIAELDEESDQDSVDEDAGEDEPYEEGSLQRLDEIKHFVFESTAYQILLRRLEEFVQPSLYSGLRNLVTKWSSTDNEHHRDVVRYKLRNLVTELQHVNPHEIKFDCDQNVSRFIKFISHYQHRVERWTGERWDWWPLPRCLRPLEDSETRLRWKCACGEERWAEVPNAFGKRFQSIIRSLPMETAATGNMLLPKADNGSNFISGSAPNSSQISNQVSHQYHGSQQPVGPSTNPSLHRRPSGLKTNTFDMSITQNRVLFLAKQGEDYRLAQIRVDNLNCHTFFCALKKEYFHLRGILRGRFSVWRYSHCDFYKFEKFDDHVFAPISKDTFPDHANTDYEYQPRPMENIPPISEHEFTKRFYACHNPRPLLHLHHRCKRLGAHSSDILKFLPKKRTELEEAGDKREHFWGIYARENVSLRWITFYNLACVSPLLVFFVAWIIPQGHSTDLQNPSIPISIMVSLLSLFWSAFLGSLQFGKSH